MAKDHKSLLKRLLDLMSNSSYYVAEAAPPEQPPVPASSFNTDALLESIRHLETRGEKNPYTFYQPSGSKISGDALGAYQVTEAKLKEQAPKVLGREVSKEEFLANPQLQDEFMKGLIDKRFVGEFKFDLPTVFAAHRGGFSNLDKMKEVRDNYQQYVSEGVNYYNNRLKQNEDPNQQN